MSIKNMIISIKNIKPTIDIGNTIGCHIDMLIKPQGLI